MNATPAKSACFFITPCPAKMTAIRSPIGQKKSSLDGAISMLEIYALMRPFVSHADGETQSVRYGLRHRLGGVQRRGDGRLSG